MGLPWKKQASVKRWRLGVVVALLGLTDWLTRRLSRWRLDIRLSSWVMCQPSESFSQWLVEVDSVQQWDESCPLSATLPPLPVLSQSSPPVLAPQPSPLLPLIKQPAASLSDGLCCWYGIESGQWNRLMMKWLQLSGQPLLEHVVISPSSFAVTGVAAAAAAALE